MTPTQLKVLIPSLLLGCASFAQGVAPPSAPSQFLDGGSGGIYFPGALRVGPSITNSFNFHELLVGGVSPKIYIEDIGITDGGSAPNSSLIYGTPTNPLAWIWGGNAAITPAVDLKEFKLADGNAVHWSLRVPNGSGPSRQYWGGAGPSVTTDAQFTYVHSIGPAVGVANNVPTFSIVGDTNAGNHHGNVLSCQASDGTEIASVNLDGGMIAQSFSAAGPITLNTASGTRPSCVVGIRGQTWFTQSAGGVADFVSICQKDAADVYAWVNH